MKTNKYLKAANSILEAKRNDYASKGDAFKNFREASKIASILSQKEITKEDVFNCIIGIKMSREANIRHNVKEVKNEPLKDTVIDELNYIALKAEALE